LLTSILRRWDEIVWQTDVSILPAWKRRVLLTFRGIQMLIVGLIEGHNSLYAKGLVYISILSLVPLLAVMFSVLKGFGVHNQLQPLLLQLLSPLGEKGIEITTTIISFVDNVKVGVLGAVGLGILLFTVISLIQHIETAFNTTWRVKKARPILERISHYISVLLVGPVLIFSAIGLSQAVQKISLFQQAVETDTGAFLYNTLSVYLPFAMTVLAITFTYMFVPNTRVKISAALFGATIATFMFKAATAVFTQFIVGSTKYDAIYSAFATVIVLFIWIYIVWLILLLGSSVAFYFQHSEKLLYLYRDEELTPYESESLALQIMVIVTRAFYSDKPPVEMASISQQLKLPDDLIENMVYQLEKGGYLKIMDDNDKSLLPGVPPEDTKCADILAYIHDSKNIRTKRARLKSDVNVVRILNSAERAALNEIQGISIKQLTFPDERRANEEFGQRTS